MTWIPVNKALPSVNERVLAINANATPKLPFLASVTLEDGLNWLYSDTSIIAHDITHWHPLPSVEDLP